MKSKSFDEIWRLKDISFEAREEFEKRIELAVERKIRLASRTYFNDYDLDDLRSILKQAVLTSMENYRDDMNKSVSSYIYMILRYRFYDCLKIVRKMKYPCEGIISLNQLIDNEGEDTLEAIIADPSSEYRPKECLDDDEGVEELYALIDGCMSEMEKEALMLSAQNYSNGEIAEIMKKDKKQISNAKERGKVKLDKVLKDKNNCNK